MKRYDELEDSFLGGEKPSAEKLIARELRRQRRSLSAERLAALFSLGTTTSPTSRAPGARRPPQRRPHPAPEKLKRPHFWRDLTPARPATPPFDAWVRSAKWWTPVDVRASRPSALPGGDSSVRPRAASRGRLLDVFPGAITWAVLLCTFLGAFWAPIVTITLTIALQLYWGVRGLGIAVFGLIGVRRILIDRKVDWLKRYRGEASRRRDVLDWQDVRHIVIVPNFKEPIHVLRNTIEALASQRQVERQILVVLAMEAKEEGAAEKAKQLQHEFDSRLGGIFYTLHPSDIPGEVPGKSANEAWAEKWAHEYFVQRMGYDISALTVTSCDADSVFHPSYFACLTYEFAANPNRYVRLWQAPLFFHNNAWDIPAFIRLVTLFMSMNQLAQLATGGRRTFPISTYSASLALVHGVGGWDTDIIPEDWHMFLKCFFARRGEVRVEPIFLPVSADAPQADSAVKTVASRYQQALRHAWGITDFRYAVSQSQLHPEIPWQLKVPKIAAVLREHLILSVSWIVLVVGFTLPHLANPTFFTTDVGAFCARLYRDLIIGATAISPIFPVMDYLLSGPPANRARWLQIPQAILEWNLMPLITIVFVALPSVHAQTKLMFGKPLAYKVTQKRPTEASVKARRENRPIRRAQL